MLIGQGRVNEQIIVKVKVWYLIQHCSTMNTYSRAFYNLGSGS